MIDLEVHGKVNGLPISINVDKIVYFTINEKDKNSSIIYVEVGNCITPIVVEESYDTIKEQLAADEFYN